MVYTAHQRMKLEFIISWTTQKWQWLRNIVVKEEQLISISSSFVLSAQFGTACVVYAAS